MSDIPSHLQTATSDIIPADNDLLKARQMGSEFFLLQKEIERLESQLKQKKEQFNELRQRTLPEFLGTIGTDKLGLPGMDADLVIKPFYAANIAASWDAARREAAFRYLESIGCGDVVKTSVSVSLPRGSMEEAKHLADSLRKMTNHEVKLDESVSHMTLAALVREQIEEGNVIDLQILGATVGCIADIKKRKK